MTPHFRRTAICLLTLATCASVATAATVRRSDDTTLTGQLIGIDDGKLTISTGTAATPVTIPLDDLTEVSFGEVPTTRPATRPATGPAAAFKPTTRPRIASSQATASTAPTTRSIDARPWKLTLADGTTLILAPTGWANGRVSGTLFGRIAVDVPVSQLRELWCGAVDQVTLARGLNESASTDDIAFAARDGKVLAVHGVADNMTDAGLRFRFGGQDRNIARPRLVGVVFAKPSTAADSTQSPHQIVTLTSGDTLSGTWTGLDTDIVSFTTAWGQPILIRRADVTKITFRNGRVVSLSDLKPSDVMQTPWFDRMLAWQVDRSLDGKPLALIDGPITRGIAMHAHTVLTYSLGGQFEELRSKVGFEQPGGKIGDAILRVTGDGQTLFEKTDAHGGDAPIDLKLKIAGVNNLTLEVDFGANQDVGDRVIWGNARLIRKP